jgi:hypothetical protein
VSRAIVTGPATAAAVILVARRRAYAVAVVAPASPASVRVVRLMLIVHSVNPVLLGVAIGRPADYDG